MKEFSYTTKILETQLDVYGHVNNARYLEFFENARWEMLEVAGLGLNHINNIKQGPVVLEANVKYKKELTNREIVIVKSNCFPSGKETIFNIAQTMYKEDMSVAAEASFIFGIMDLVKRKLIRPDKKWLDSLGIN